MSNQEIKEKSEALAKRIRSRIAMCQEDFEWLAFQIECLGTNIKIHEMLDKNK